MYLLEIFQDNSDKARLITTIIGVTIALIVVLLNQHFNTKRSRKETLIEKVEKLHEEVTKITKIWYQTHMVCLEFWDKKDDCDARLKELHMEYFDSLSVIETISDLYFDKAEMNIKKLVENYGKLTAEFVSTNDISEYIELYRELTGEVDPLFDDSKNKAITLMRNVMH